MLRRLFSGTMVALAILLAPLPAYADGPTIKEAQSAVIVDEMGQILWGLEPEARMNPASLTKIMTAMVALDSGLDLDAPCTVYPVDFGEYSQDIGHTEKDSPTLRELIDVMLIFSANDAAYQIAMNVAGSEPAFVELMNQKARNLGMDGTSFANSHGLDQEGHYSCALDLVTMARYALRNYPLIAHDVQQPSVKATVGGNSFWVDSTDEMMGTYEGLIGVKTGKGLDGKTAFLGAAERSGVRVYTCVLGCETDEGRFEDTRIMMDWAFAHFREVDLPNRIASQEFVPFAFDFRFRCPLIERESGRHVVDTAPGAQPLAYSTSRLFRGTLLTQGDVYAITLWTQGGRVVGTTFVEVGRPELVRPEPPLPEGVSIEPDPIAILP